MNHCNWKISIQDYSTFIKVVLLNLDCLPHQHPEFLIEILNLGLYNLAEYVI